MDNAKYEKCIQFQDLLKYPFLVDDDTKIIINDYLTMTEGSWSSENITKYFCREVYAYRKVLDDNILLVETAGSWNSKKYRK